MSRATQTPQGRRRKAQRTTCRKKRYSRIGVDLAVSVHGGTSYRCKECGSLHHNPNGGGE